RRFSGRSWLQKLVAPAGLAMLLVVIAMGIYNWRVTGNPLRLPYQEYLDQYQERRMFVWGEGQSKTYNHPSLANVYRYIRAQEGVPVRTKLMTTAKRIGMFYFGPVLLASLVLAPMVLRDKRFRPLLMILALSAIGLAAVEWLYIHYLAPLTG